MDSGKIFSQDYDSGQRLAELGLVARDLIEVVKRAVAAKASYVTTFPSNAAGQLSYIYGTGALREILLSKGWKQDRSAGIESIYHPKVGIKIVFQNADSACEDRREPRAISDKGPAASKAVDCGQMYLFPDIAREEAALSARENAPLWYLFVLINGDDVRAELSFPRSIEDRQFKGFNERIYVIKQGEWTSIAPKTDIDETKTTEQDFDVEVTRKN